MLGQILSDLAQVDTWLDEYVSEQYKEQPLAQHWGRLAKIGEEFGEVVDAYIALTGQNPRKAQTVDIAELMGELSDVVFTAMLAMLHFTKDPATVGRYLVDGQRKLSRRMMEDKGRRAHEAMIARRDAANGAWDMAPGH